MKYVAYPIAMLSSLLLAAHFLRSADYFIVSLCLLSPGLAFFREKWAARTYQLFHFAAAVIWLDVARTLIGSRIEQGLPMTRLAAILAAVVLISLAAAALPEWAGVKSRFRRNQA